MRFLILAVFLFYLLAIRLNFLFGYGLSFASFSKRRISYLGKLYKHIDRYQYVWLMKF